MLLGAMFGSMTQPPVLTARINIKGGPEIGADYARIPWWSFTKTALATAALQLVARGDCRLDKRTGLTRCANCFSTVQVSRTTATSLPIMSLFGVVTNLGP